MRGVDVEEGVRQRQLGDRVGDGALVDPLGGGASGLLEVGHQVGQRVGLDDQGGVQLGVRGQRRRDDVDVLLLVARLAGLVRAELARRRGGGAVTPGHVVDDEHRHHRLAAGGLLRHRIVEKVRQRGQVGDLAHPDRGGETGELVELGRLGRVLGRQRLDGGVILGVHVHLRADERVDVGRVRRGGRNDRSRLHRRRTRAGARHRAQTETQTDRNNENENQGIKTRHFLLPLRGGEHRPSHRTKETRGGPGHPLLCAR